MVAKKLEPILRLPAKPLTIEHNPAPERNGKGSCLIAKPLAGSLQP